MATLEPIKGTDIGSVAIKKLDRNIKLVNLDTQGFSAAINENTNKINILDRKIITNYNVTATQTIEEIVNSIPDYCILIGNLGVANPNFPTSFGTLIIHKWSNVRCTLDYTQHDSNNKWQGVYHNGVSPKFSGWKPIATTEIINLSTITFLNGFERYSDLGWGGISKTGNTVHINLLLSGSKGTVGQYIFALPFLNKFREMHDYNGIRFSTEDGFLKFFAGTIPTSSFFSVNVEYTCV